MASTLIAQVFIGARYVVLTFLRIALETPEPQGIRTEPVKSKTSRGTLVRRGGLPFPDYRTCPQHHRGG